MTLIATPIQMITSPNYYSILSDNRWEVTNPNAQDVWLQLALDDNLGYRRYIPAAGSTLSIIFQRSYEFSVGSSSNLNRLQYDPRTITKVATADSNDRSLWKISLTSADISGLVSGTVKFSITESGSTSVWVQNYFIKKNLTDPGF